MPWLLAGAVALVALIYFGGKAKDADPKALAQGVRIAGIAALGVAAVALTLMGRIGLGVLAGAGAAGLWRTVFAKREAPKIDTGASGSAGNRNHQNRKQPSSGGMDRQEALAILGLDENASDEDIQQAYRRLMAQMHPDKGGSDWMAARLNEAKDSLLEK